MLHMPNCLECLSKLAVRYKSNAAHHLHCKMISICCSFCWAQSRNSDIFINFVFKSMFYLMQYKLSKYILETPTVNPLFPNVLCSYTYLFIILFLMFYVDIHTWWASKLTMLTFLNQDCYQLN